MALAYAPDEVFEMAIRVEENGAAFYRSAVDRLTDSKAREMLEDLAREEDRHAGDFRTLRSCWMADETGIALYDDPDGTVARYLRAIAGNYVFTQDPRTVFNGSETPADIIRSGLQHERDSIVLYVGIRDMMAHEDDRKKIEAIIEEEKKHIIILSDWLQDNT